MQVGDPKKTVLLGIVAVGAIGFLGSRVLALRADVPKALRRAVASEPSGQPNLMASVPEQLRTDPFSHPKLAPHFPGNETTPDMNPAGAGSKGTNPPDYAPIFVPEGGGTSIEKIPPPDWPTSTTPGDHTSTKGQDPTPVAKPATKVSLKAIFKVDQRTAYLEIDGSDPRPFHIGDLIKDDLVLVMINDDSVILKNSKHTLTLRTGQQGEL